MSFVWNPLSYSEQAGSDKFKMKIYVASEIWTHATQRHDPWNNALDHSTTLVRYQVGYV